MSETEQLDCKWHQPQIGQWVRDDGVDVIRAGFFGNWYISGDGYNRPPKGPFDAPASAMDYADRFVPDRRTVDAPAEWTPPPEETKTFSAEFGARFCENIDRLYEDKATKALSDDNPKTAYGDRKPPLHLVPPALTIAAAGVFKLGARKYGAYNWREKTVSSSVYVGAALRHLHAYWDGEDIDPESGESHLAHAAACLGILLDAGAIDRLNDNRPVAGAAARIIREKEEKGE